MRLSNIILVVPFVLFYGCQPQAPAPEKAAPAVTESAAPSASVAQDTPPAASETSVAAPVRQEEAKPAEKIVPPPVRKDAAIMAKEKIQQPEAVDKPPQPATAQPIAAPATKTEPVADIKPEAGAEPVVSEADAMQLAKKNNCLACHAIDKKVVGPAWKDVADKYRGDASAEARLMDKIAKGGSGVWGGMMMPPTPQASEEQRRVLARYILSLK